jgi:hypothetical protein
MLRELKLAGELMPNQSILSNTLPILEARATSEIEDIERVDLGPAPIDELAGE